jgi:hypothetical protein
VIAAAVFEVEYLAGMLQVSRWLLWVPSLTLELVWWAYRAGFHTAGELFDAATMHLADTATEQVLLVGVTVLTILVTGVLIYEFARQLRRRIPAEQSQAWSSASPTEDRRGETRATS